MLFLKFLLYYLQGDITLTKKEKVKNSFFTLKLFLLIFIMFAFISKIFNFLNKLDKKKDPKKIELKTINTLTKILSISKKIAKNNKKVKIIPFGFPSIFRDQCKNCIEETIILNDEKLKCKLLYINEPDSIDDFIIYLHGTARDHTQWIEKNGFGIQFKEIFNNMPISIVSLSFGMSYIIKNNLPFPFECDLENIFIYKIIPHIRKNINKNGNIHLIGHSIGAFSAFNLCFKYPDVFKSVFAISPFITKYSPFNNDFEYYKNAIYDNPSWSYFIKYNLIHAFQNENEWANNNPFDLVDKIDSNKISLIIITEAEEELLGFNENIEAFRKKLNDKKVKYFYYKVKGDHHRCDIREGYKIFYNELKK